LTPNSQGNGAPDAHRGARYTFARLHLDTAALEPTTKAEIFNALPERLQAQAWAALRHEVDLRRALGAAGSVPSHF
jgi:hypothetical protein